MDNNWREERGDTLLYIIYRRPTPACPRVAMGIAPLKGHESILNTFSKGPFRPGREREGEGNYKRKSPWKEFTPTEDEGVTILRTRV